MFHENTNHPRDEPPGRSSTGEPETICSETLFQGRREVRLLHGNEVYRLILTRNGKLLLVK